MNKKLQCYGLIPLRLGMFFLIKLNPKYKFICQKILSKVRIAWKGPDKDIRKYNAIFSQNYVS